MLKNCPSSKICKHEQKFFQAYEKVSFFFPAIGQKILKSSYKNPISTMKSYFVLTEKKFDFPLTYLTVCQKTLLPLKKYIRYRCHNDDDVHYSVFNENTIQW